MLSISYENTGNVNRVAEFFCGNSVTGMNRAEREAVILHAMDFPDDFSDSSPSLPVLTVSELNRMARRALESQLPLLWVEARCPTSPAPLRPLYFSLKDASAQVRCVMFRGRNQFG